MLPLGAEDNIRKKRLELRSEEPCNSESSINGRIRNEYKIYFAKSEEKTRLGRPTRKIEIQKERVCEGTEGIHLIRDIRISNGHEAVVTEKGWEFLD